MQHSYWLYLLIFRGWIFILKVFWNIHYPLRVMEDIAWFMTHRYSWNPVPDFISSFTLTSFLRNLQIWLLLPLLRLTFGFSLVSTISNRFQIDMAATMSWSSDSSMLSTQYNVLIRVQLSRHINWLIWKYRSSGVP